VNADDVIRLLDLAPHPEGGFYRETWRDTPASGGRGAGTAIYFLLRGGERSRWHRVDAAELWHFYGGAPVELAISRDARTQERLRLGPDLTGGARPQLVVPPGAWQSAVSLGADAAAWSLVGCTVSPAFELARFELAPPDFAPR